MTRYIVDQDHSSVGFMVRHAGIGKTRGNMTVFEGVIDVPNPDSWDGAQASGSIDAASVDTKSKQRDDHLRSADFFDVENFPKWKFHSTEVTGERENFKLTGDLEIHGVTKPITLDVTYLGSATDPFGAERIAFEAEGELSRKDYGLTWNAALETGGFLVGDKIKVNLEIEAVLEK